MGHGEAVKDPSVVSNTFLLNNTYACVLVDSGAERSFVSHQFKQLLKQTPHSLKDTYVVEMANGKEEHTNDIYSGCTLTLDNHSFKVDLMPVTIKCFDIIIGMDWLSSHRADILCYERAVRLNLPNGETLFIYGDKPSSNLQVISCVKAQKYLRKEYHAFLAHIVDTKREVKDINDIPEVCNYPDVFPEDLPGVPSARQVEFRIDLILGATPVAKSPYRLAPAEMQELSVNLTNCSTRAL